MIHPLQLKYRPGLEGTPDAWFLPGNSAAQWPEELARCGLATLETRLFVIPRSLKERTPAGLLAIPAPGNAASKQPFGIPCRLIAGRLCVPADSVLHPPISDSELRALCPLAVSFFHPVHGLSSFEEEDALRISDLISLPAERPANWNFAQPGAPALPELTALVLVQPPSVEDMFGDAGQEIGSEPMADLPPAPDEPKGDPVTNARRNLRRIFARSIVEVTRHVPHTGPRRTWLNDVEDWANRQLHGLSEQLGRLRNKELHRLLHLLDTDPEQGLRHAIPLNSFPHRGIAPPGARLGPRPIHFHPDKIGGGPADFWAVPPDLQDVLRRRYREMADREMQLGLHRRAAYIYAELLGDLVSAAHALKQGGLFREAATLYEEVLQNPLEAARCLAEAGLLAEAIERFEKLNRWLDVAGLHERAGDRAAAETAFRRVVNERLAQQDMLGAAELVEKRLQAPDEALALLLGAWPGSQQAVSCLTGAFKLLARLGRHEVALDRLTQFGREPLPDRLIKPVITMLAGTAHHYPDERVRHRAADFSRVLIARQLQRRQLSNEATGSLLAQLVQLAPQDRLLARDANRYLAEHRSAARRAIRLTPPPVPGNKPVVHRRFELPRQIQWLQLRRESHWFYALGVTPKRLTLLRGIFEGEYQSLSWQCPAELVKQGFVFEPTIEQGRAVALARPDGAPLAQMRFPAADLFYNTECLAGTPPWLPAQAFPCAFGEDAVWTVHLANGRAILSCHSKTTGQLQQTIDISNDIIEGAERTDDTRLSLAVLANTVAISLGNRLVLTRPEGGLTRVELPGQAVGLVPTLTNTRKGLAVMLHQGAVMYWVGAESWIELDRDLQSPIAAFIPSGPLVLASGLQLVLLETDSQAVRSVSRMESARERIVGVSAAENAGEFAVLEERGAMTIYRMPR